MAITDALRTRESKAGQAGQACSGGKAAADGCGEAHRDGDTSGFKPVPIWFFTFEGLMGASYDILKSDPHAWIFLAASVVVNIVLARTVLRGRLKMARAMLRGKRTRKIAVGLIALRVGMHVALGAAGVQVTSGPAHIALAVAMCAATIWLLAFNQRVMLRALAAA